MASALKFGTALRTQLADSMGGAWDSGSLVIYDTAPPANPQATYSGVALATITLPASAFAAAIDGVVSKDGTWSDTVDESGTAAGFRMLSSDTTKVIDGTAGVSGDSPDMVLDNKVLVAGGTVTVNTFSFTQPE
jgi:hypothetical protein